LKNRLLQSLVYLAAAPFIGFFTLRAIAIGVWGVPIARIQYVALAGVLLLLCAGLVSLFAQRPGRNIALIAITALGAWWIPVTQSIVPGHDLVRGTAFFSFLIVAVYFATVAFTLFYPTRLKWSVAAFALVLGAGALIPSSVAIERSRAGEFEWPAFDSYRWTATNEELDVSEDSIRGFPAAELRMLRNGGLRGRLKFEGSIGRPDAAHRVIVLMQRQVPAPQRLYFPKSGTLVYAFDGSTWRAFPADAPPYPSYAEVEPTGMLWQQSAGGGTTGYHLMSF